MADQKKAAATPSLDGTSEFDEPAAMKALQRDVSAVLKPFEVITKLKPSSPESLAALEKALAALPEADRLVHALSELVARGRDLVTHAKQERVAAFRRGEAAWVRNRQATGTVVREVGATTWRTGMVEVEVNREKAEARAKYNREPIGPARTIRSPEDLDALVAGAEKELANAALKIDDFRTVSLAAYEFLAHSQGGAQGRVPLNTFYREFRVCLARHELSGKPDRKLTTVDFPRWAFLHNLDLYRAATANEGGAELLLEQGSQHDHQKGLAVVLNGLDAAQDYRSYCYVYAAKR